MVTKGEMDQHGGHLQQMLDLMRRYGRTNERVYQLAINNLMTKEHWVWWRRESTAPNEPELREMMRRRLFELDTTPDTAARRAGIEGSAIRRTIASTRSPSYPILVKVCAALGIELTVTPPDQNLPRIPPAGAEPPDPATLEARAPSPDELREMVKTRVKAINKILRGDRARMARLRKLRGLKRHSIENISKGHIPRYEELRKVLAGIELDLIIRPWNEPLPERIRHARFTWNRACRIKQLREHRNGTDIQNRKVRNAPSPADVYDDDSAIYVIWPHESVTPAGIAAGDYCLATESAPISANVPIWVELTDGTEIVGIKLEQSWSTMKGHGNPPMRILTQTGPEDGGKTVIAEVPTAKLKTRAAMIAAYPWIPTVKRPPHTRLLA